jgi:hypothetical protein
METRFLLRASQRLRLPPPLRHLQTRPASSNSKPSTQQANPIGDYYASLLEYSSPAVASKLLTSATSAPPAISTTPADTDSEPRILFSSRLSSPLERRSEIKRKSVLVAGVWVPPKPDEPDNCCMSGCVNCVWDRYGEEIEEWAAARKEADKALRKDKGYEREKKKRRISGTGLMLREGEKGAQHMQISMDDDGGGSETNWGTGLETDFTTEDLFKGVPVGIREFMKTEKRLKEKHAREGTLA